MKYTPSIQLSTVIFILGAFTDGVTTLHLTKQPTFVEGNIIVREILHTSGIFGVFIFKIGLYVTTLLLIAYFHNQESSQYTKSEWISLSTFIFGGIWLLAGAWNISLFLLV